MTPRDYRFFDVARDMAKLSTWSEHPGEQVGAIIVLRNEIISTGYNRRKTFPMQAYWAEKAGRPAAVYPHAEISALHKLSNSQEYDVRMSGIGKVYVYRETALGLGIARPCEICTMALKAFGIKRVFYTTDQGYAEEIWE
jgi:deoxycytidylate deaminase